MGYLTIDVSRVTTKNHLESLYSETIVYYYYYIYYYYFKGRISGLKAGLEFTM